MPLKFNPITGKFDLVNGQVTPSGTNGAVQYNNGGSFGGFGVFDDTTNLLTLPGNLSVSTNVVIAHALRSDASDGVEVQASNSTTVAILGAANTTNSLFYGGVNINGNLTDFASSTFSPTTDIAPVVIQAGGTSTSIKTLDLKDSSGNSWFYARKRLLSDSNVGFLLDFTTSGTGGTSRSGQVINGSAGYTGAEFTSLLGFDNAIAGTAAYYLADATTYGYRPGGNRGGGGFSRAVTVGVNVGWLAMAGGGSTNYGLWTGATITKANAINVGVFANAHNASGTNPSWIGLYATCFNTNLTAPPNMSGVKTALLADNQTFACDIGIFRDNGSNVFTIADNGATSVTPVATAGGLTAFTVFPGAHTAVTAERRSVYVRGNTVTITGSFSEQNTSLFDGQTFDAATAQTITTASTVTINGAPGVTGSAAITNAYAFWVKAGNARFDNRVLSASAGITAANDLTLGSANQQIVSGNTQINAITTAGWRAGSQVTLIFSGTPTVKHNTAGGAGTAVILLAGSVDLVAAANTVLCLEYDGTSWQETSRKVA